VTTTPPASSGAAGTSDTSELRLAELIAALSLAVDLGFDQPMEHVLRQTIIALRIADRLGLDTEVRATLYYTALLVNVGCHADAHEQAKWFGDDIALKATKYGHDARSVPGALAGMRLIGSGHPPLHRLRVALQFAFSGHREVDSMISRHAELARGFATSLGLDAAVQHAVASSYERWDGRGWPGHFRGQEIPLPARISQFAEHVEVAHRMGGARAAAALARERSGRQFDPALVALVERHGADLFHGLESARTLETVIDAEPVLADPLRGAALDAALVAVADFADLKSPYTLGHSRAVADLSAAAGRGLGMSDADVTALYRAGLVHDLGRLGVSNSIWDKAGPLGAGERERVRLYPYLTERILSQSPALARLGALAVQHRERLDGSGYPRGLRAGSLSGAARTLAVADLYRSLREQRPHRAALGADDASSRLRAEARDGRLDPESVEAVLAAAGQRAVRRHSRPSGLSPREVEILRLIARGLSSREIAERLTLSPKTVRNHTEHIYAKIGTGNRVSASLFAVEHGLLTVD
jgi:HD-GYP domain-containing protein (c-di-GMP phosphodiesterase class II)